MVHAESPDFHKHPARLDFGDRYLCKGDFFSRGDFINTYSFHGLPPYYRLNRTVFKAVAAMQTVLLTDIRFAVLHIYRSLRTD